MLELNNIPNPQDQNLELLAILWDGLKIMVMGIAIVHVVNEGDLKG